VVFNRLLHNHLLLVGACAAHSSCGVSPTLLLLLLYHCVLAGGG
jgi:hypothetical protein